MVLLVVVCCHSALEQSLRPVRGDGGVVVVVVVVVDLVVVKATQLISSTFHCTPNSIFLQRRIIN